MCAILVVHDGEEWLEENLDALASQSRPPDRVVVVDVASSDGSLEIVRSHRELARAIPDLTVVSLPEPMSFGAAVARALADAAPDEDPAREWLWLLHDDSAADPHTLGRLLEAVRRSPSVGVAGPKIVQWHDPRRLVEMGHQLTRSGRRVDAPGFGEADQGQYDTRTDVLAVGTSGMLVRRDVFLDVDGFDSSFEQFGSDLDFGWRAQLAGHRVIVVPGARMREASATRLGVRAGGPDPAGARRAQRRATRRIALTRCAPMSVPFVAVWMAVSSVLGAVALLVLKRPQHAWAELGDLGALVHPVSSIRSRWRFRSARRLRREHLSSLFVSAGGALAHTGDRILDALAPDRVGERPDDISSAASETGPVAEEAEDLTVLPTSLPQRVATHPGTLAVLAAMVLSGIFFRDALRLGVLDAQGEGLAGGELLPVATGSAGLWHLFRDAWHGAGFGTSLDVGPQVGVLAGVTWLVERLPYVADGRSAASVTMAWLLLAAMPLSTATAYLAGRVATSSRWARAVVALAWGSSGVLVAALTQGRLSVVVAHILLPLVVAGFAAAAQRRATFTATFATALATGLLGAFVPAMLVVSVVAGLVLLVFLPGWTGRSRALVLTLVPTALLGPWVLAFVHQPALLLTGGGLVDVNGGTAAAWQLALGQPDGGRRLLALLFVPLLLVALLALTRPGRTVALTAMALLAVLGLAVALGAPRVVVGQVGTADQPALTTLWSGVGVELYVAAVLAAILTGWHGIGAMIPDARRASRRTLAVAGAAAIALAVGAAGVVNAGTGLGDAVTVGHDALPAVAVDQATGPEANRLLVLMPSTDRLDYRLVGNEPGDLLRDVDRPNPATDPGLRDLVGSIASGVGALPGGAGSHLADLGIGFVSLRAAPGSPLARSLDASAGLTRLGATDNQTLWRVVARSPAPGASSAAAVPPSRVRLVDSQGAPLQAVDVVGPHGAVDGQLPAGAEGRKVVFAEAPEWAGYATVTVDGVPISRAAQAGPPAYAVPASGGHLVVDLPPTHAEWFLGQLALLALVIFLAIPFGNRRSRRLL